MTIICPYLHNHHSKKNFNTVHNLITFSIVFTNKNRGGGHFQPPPPPPRIYKNFLNFSRKHFEKKTLTHFFLYLWKQEQEEVFSYKDPKGSSLLEIFHQSTIFCCCKILEYFWFCIIILLGQEYYCQMTS